MSTYEAFYDVNPVATLDQNVWDERIAELVLQFRQQPVVYTPMIDWDNRQQQTGAQTSIFTELLEGDTDVDTIPFTANYIGVTTGVDSRARKLSSSRYGDKVQLHESSNIFQQWNLSGGRDWRPLLRGLLGANVIKKHELLARNAYVGLTPSDFRTYAGGATDFATIASDDVFDLDIINEWNLRLGNTGSPVIPGDGANAKVCMMPPGMVYDFQKQLATASQNETSLWRDVQLYSGQAIRYEIGTHKGVRFVQVPNNKYGENLAVLYNAGTITKQVGVSQAIKMGDGAPDPDVAADMVDDVWMVGQKGATHYVQCTSGSDLSSFAKGDIVSIHTQRTNAFGVTNGVNILSGKTITRRIVKVVDGSDQLVFDRPVMFNYDTPFIGTPNGGSEGTLYAYITKARHIGFCLILGARGGIMGEVARPIKFYEPKPIDDFESVWRFVWDAYEGYNLWEPNLYECHFAAVTLPKAGGVITP